jgi:hypothetical protein
MSEYNVAKLAEALNTDAASTRAKLRSAGVEKTDGKYQWANQKEFQAVVKQLGGKTSGEGEKSKKSKKDKGAAPENKAEVKAEGKKGKKKSKK